MPAIPPEATTASPVKASTCAKSCQVRAGPRPVTIDVCHHHTPERQVLEALQSGLEVEASRVDPAADRHLAPKRRLSAQPLAGDPGRRAPGRANAWPSWRAPRVARLPPCRPRPARPRRQTALRRRSRRELPHRPARARRKMTRCGPRRPGSASRLRARRRGRRRAVVRLRPRRRPRPAPADRRTRSRRRTGRGAGARTCQPGCRLQATAPRSRPRRFLGADPSEAFEQLQTR